jgi:hypothetical protein
VVDSLEDPSGEGKLLPKGEYRSETLTVPIRYITFDPVSVWIIGDTADIIGPTDFAIHHHRSLSMVEFVGLPLPEQVPRHDHAPTGSRAITGQSDMDGFFADEPGLVLIESGTETVADTNATWWEFTSHESDSDGYHCPYGDNWTYRIWQLPHADGFVHAWFQSKTSTYADDLPWGQSLLEGFTIGS